MKKNNKKKVLKINEKSKKNVEDLVKIDLHHAKLAENLQNSGKIWKIVQN